MSEYIVPTVLGMLAGGTLLGLVFYDLYRFYFNHLGPKKESKGVLLEKKSDVRYCPGFSASFRSTVRLRSRFWATFLVEGKPRVFSCGADLWETLAEGKKYRLLCQGDRLISVKRAG